MFGCLSDRRNIDLTQKSFERLLAYGNLGQQRLDRNGASVFLRSRKHYASHSALADNADHLIIRDRLRILFKLFAAVVTDKR